MRGAVAGERVCIASERGGSKVYIENNAVSLLRGYRADALEPL